MTAARALVAVLLCVGVAAGGDATDEYRQRFRDGMAHYKAGRYAQAVDHWEPIAEALGDAQGYRLLYDLGVACDELGRATRAAAYLTRFRGEVEKRGEATPEEVREFDRDAARRVARLVASHGRLSVIVRGGEALRVRVDGEERTRDLGLPLFLAPGRHEVVLRPGADREERRVVELSAGRVTELVVEAPPLPPPVVVAVPEIVRVPEIVTVRTPTRRPVVSPIWVGVAAGATVASVALPLALRSRATATKRQYDDPETSPRERDALAERYDSERSRYELSWALPATLALGTGALVALLAWGPEREARGARGWRF